MARKPRTYGYGTVKEARAVLAQAKREGRFQPTKPIREYRGENVRRIARTLESNPQVKNPQELRDIARGRGPKAKELPAEGNKRAVTMPSKHKNGRYHKRDLIRAVNKWPGPLIAVGARGDLIYVDLSIGATNEHYKSMAEETHTINGKNQRVDVAKGIVLGVAYPKGQLLRQIEAHSSTSGWVEIELLLDTLIESDGYWANIRWITFAQGVE